MGIKEKYIEYIKDWENKINEDEWYLYRFRDEIVKNSNPEEAFLVIPDVCELLLEQKDEFLFSEMFELLLSLARKSNTTEIPSVLEDNWNTLESIIMNYKEYQQNLFDELKKWYRME